MTQSDVLIEARIFRLPRVKQNRIQNRQDTINIQLDMSIQQHNNVLNIPNGVVLVPVQMQPGGTGLVPGSSPDTSLLEFLRRSPQVLGVNTLGYSIFQSITLN